MIGESTAHIKVWAEISYNVRKMADGRLLNFSLFNGMSDSTGKVSGSLVTKPFQAWQKKSEKFANHEKTSYHQCSLQMAEQLLHSVEHPERNS